VSEIYFLTRGIAISCRILANSPTTLLTHWDNLRVPYQCKALSPQINHEPPNPQGITLADHLNRRFARDVEVVVISSENYMVFTPMLAEVAGRSLCGLDVVLPGRQIAPRPAWLTATVTGVDLYSRA
jgi:hypothetical protein